MKARVYRAPSARPIRAPRNRVYVVGNTCDPVRGQCVPNPPRKQTGYMQLICFSLLYGIPIMIRMKTYVPREPNAFLRQRETVVNAAGQGSLRPFRNVECSQCHSVRLHNITNIRSQIHESTMCCVLQHACTCRVSYHV